MYVFVFGVVAMGAKQIVPGTKCETREMRNNKYYHYTTHA